MVHSADFAAIQGLRIAIIAIAIMVAIMSRIRQRADDVLSRAERTVGEDFRVMLADRAAKGALRSGATITQAVEIYQSRLSAALVQLQDEIGKQIEHRGKAWKEAIAAVQAALETCEGRSAQAFERVWPAMGAAQREIDLTNAKLAEVFAALRAQCNEFADGWTAPLPKRWQERNPVWYAVTMLAIGAAFGATGTLLTDAFKEHREKPCPPAAAARLPNH